MKNQHKTPFFIVILFFIARIGFAGESLFGVNQKSVGFLHLPYSSPGLARSYEMASTDSLQLNFLNFSLWTKIPTTTYSVMAGYKAALGDDGIKDNYFSALANFQGGFLGIPIIKEKLVAGFGLQPISFMDRRYSDILADSLLETIYIRGGLSRAALKIAYSFNPRIGLGIAYEYTFGKISDNYKIEEEGVAVSRIGFDYDYRFYGHGFAVSAFAQPLKDVHVGMLIRPAVKTSVLVKAFSSSRLVNESQVKTVTLPAQYHFGLQYSINRRMHLGLDFLYQNWLDGYEISNQPYTKDQDVFYRFGLGFERTSSERRFIELKEQMDYRIGLFYGGLNQKSNDQSVREYGLSLGLSLPIQRYVSRIDISGLVGKRGDLSKNNYEEWFLSVGFTLSARELWFVNLEE
jgi:hypothetical protein